MFLCRSLARLAPRVPPPPPPRPKAPAQVTAADSSANSSSAKTQGQAEAKPHVHKLWDGSDEHLTAAEHEEKQRLVKELTKRLAGPLADENGKVPTGDARPTAIEVDGPSHFYANSTRYTAYTKLKHRLLTRMGYRVLHVPYFDWRRLRGAKEREAYMRTKLEEQPTEWLDPEDEAYYKSQTEAQEAEKIPPPSA